MKRKFDLYLKDILNCISKIEKYVENNSFEEFSKKDILIDAVLNNLLIIGEASNQLQIEIKEKYNKVPWQLIIDFRNVGIHKYHIIKLPLVWDIIENELPKLKKQIKDILKKELKDEI